VFLRNVGIDYGHRTQKYHLRIHHRENNATALSYVSTD
jgi:hypothetical protein